MQDEWIEGLGPCIAILHGPTPTYRENFYGPFESGKKAMEWANHQIAVGFVRSFSISPLRTPYRKRNRDDWWAGDWHQVTITDQEYPKDSWIKTKRRVWRRWRRQADKVLKQLV
jgi:hypothetical protein